MEPKPKMLRDIHPKFKTRSRAIPERYATYLSHCRHIEKKVRLIRGAQELFLHTTDKTQSFQLIRLSLTQKRKNAKER